VIAKDIQEWRSAKLNERRAGLKVTVAEDWETKGVLERLGGESVLKDILRKTLPHREEHVVKAITGGYSGAIVLNVSSRGSGSGTAEARNIVKISSSDYDLHEELRRRPFQGTWLDIASTTARTDAPVKAAQWYAFCVPEIRGGITLEDFLLSREVTPRSGSVLEQVVTECLVEPALGARDQGIGEEVSRLELNFSFLAALKKVLDELFLYDRVFGGKTILQLKSVREFLARLASGNFQLRSPNRLAAPLHGDFHCRNVMLTKDLRPQMLDFRRGAVYPRLFDIACLDVDLIVRVLDISDGEHWRMSNLPCWWRSVKAGYPFKVKEAGTDHSVLLLRQMLHRALLKQVPSVSDLEYAEVLIFQLLRYIRFADVSLPKKVLGAKWVAELVSRFGMGG
jgi:hypothetical protein